MSKTSPNLFLFFWGLKGWAHSNFFWLWGFFLSFVHIYVLNIIGFFLWVSCVLPHVLYFVPIFMCVLYTCSLHLYCMLIMLVPIAPLCPPCCFLRPHILSHIFEKKILFKPNTSVHVQHFWNDQNECWKFREQFLWWWSP
jgi:hypothetical protein